MAITFRCASARAVIIEGVVASWIINREATDGSRVESMEFEVAVPEHDRKPVEQYTRCEVSQLGAAAAAAKIDTMLGGLFSELPTVVDFQL